MNLHRTIEQRTGWLFGTYRAMNADDPCWPLLSVGCTVATCGLEKYRSGVYVTLGARGAYLSRIDGLERGRARQVDPIEVYANRGQR